MTTSGLTFTNATVAPSTTSAIEQWYAEYSPAQVQSVPPPISPDVDPYTLTDEYKSQVKKKLDKYKDVPVVDMPSKRRIHQPKFRHLLESVKDFEIRLLRSIIHIGTTPYLVEGVWSYDKDFWLVVADENGVMFKIPYSHSAVDLRNPDPQYIQVDQGPAYLVRWPAREQAQGICSKNTSLKFAGTGQFSVPKNLRDIIHGLKFSDNIQWSPSYEELMKNRIFRALRLSPFVSVYRNHDTLWAEYKGRPLGKIKENTVFVDTDDFERPWVRRDVTPSGLTLKVQ